MKPQLITENFLSPQECQHVFERILHYQSQWFDVKDTCLPVAPSVDATHRFANFFGPSVYCLHSKLDQYLELKNKYNKILANEFENIYRRLREAVANTLQRETYYCDDVSYPGFHIFGPGLDNKTVRYDYFLEHQDLYPNAFRNIIPYSEIFSFIIPVRLPASGAALNYSNNIYEYRCGSLSYWHGTMPHKIAAFDLTGANDYRITWQIHVAVNDKLAIIFW